VAPGAVNFLFSGCFSTADSRFGVLLATLWKAVRDKGYGYKDRTGGSDGVIRVRLTGGAAGKSKLQLVGKGVNLSRLTTLSPAQFLSNSTGVTAQLREINGACCETAVAREQVAKNNGKTFWNSQSAVEIAVDHRHGK